MSDSNLTSSENVINFVVIKENLQNFTTETGKIEHLPIFDHGSTILTKLNQILSRLDQLQTTQNQLLVTQNQFQQETAANFV